MRYWFACALLLTAIARAELFPFVMSADDAGPVQADISSWNHKPAGKLGFVRAENGHLYAGVERIRFLGVNVVFGGAFPEHGEADKTAARLARFGINAVRFHHLDTRPAPDGLLQKDMKTLDSAQLDRFDYFVAALKRHGIYSDINLHVGRKYPGFADWGEDTPKYWKGVDLFYPPMIALQKDYARDLLTHRNRYTGLVYAEESAVALVEINNENGLIREWQNGNLDGMAEPYRGELKRRWLAWLKKHYSNTAALKSGWGVRSRSKGPELLHDRVAARGQDAGWQLQGSAHAKLFEEESGALRLDLLKSGTETGHVQVSQALPHLKAEEPYALGLRLRADRPMKITVALTQARAPWQRLWSQELHVSTDWQNWRPTFALLRGEENARLTISELGKQTGRLWLGGISLRAGGLFGLQLEESLEAGNLEPPLSTEFLSLTPQAQRDWLTFLWETEVDYWRGMQAFLRDELGVKAPIIGTQAGYSPAPIQGLLDVVDAHAYWQHPRFPGKPWDPEHWTIANTPMAGIANGGTIADLASRRVPGKPFVVTEYNHSAPSLYQAEAMPLIAAWGAMQDWDGVFVFSYGGHQKQSGVVNSFFDIESNPLKMASLIASAALLRRGDVRSPMSAAGVVPDTARWIEALRLSGKSVGAEALGVVRTDALRSPVSVAGRSTQTSSQLHWGATTRIDTPLSKGVIGLKAGVQSLSGVDVELLSARNDWGVLMATVIDGTGFDQPGRILLSALGQMENTDQRWRDEKKTSVGRQWGKAPTRIEGLGARIVLPVEASRVDVWALDASGKRMQAVPISGQERAVIELGPQYQTLWYEVEILPASLTTLRRWLR